MQKIHLLLEKHTDYQLGFEVQLPEKQFVPWTLTYDEVIALPFVELDAPFDSDYEVVEYYYFKYPVCVGNILFLRFEFALIPEQRTDIAVCTYFAKSEKGATDFDYWQFYHELEKNLPTRSNELYPKNDWAWFLTDTLSVMLTYHKDPEQQNLEISFSDEREYPELLFPIENENTMQITDYVLFEKDDVAINSDYKTHQSVKRRPPLLTEKFGDKAVLWRDEVHQEIGVSVGDYCNIFPLPGIEKVEVYRILPARGGGSDTLNLRCKTELRPISILEAKEYYFDNHWVVLEKFFRMSVDENGGYHNC